nr:retrovirus-related Pol polyprotein from transposon TNT 1-94 [Tanacetum cinerariifolium]
MKFENVHLCSACEQRKINRKHHKSTTAFASNKPLYLLHMDLCGPMRVESKNGKLYVLVVVDDYSRYTWRVRTDNGTEFKNKTLAKFFDEDVGKLKAKRDIGVFVGYSKESVAFRIYNKRTRKIHESVNVSFDEISEMASKQFSLEPGLSNLNKTEQSSNLVVSQASESSKKDLEGLFQNFYDEYFDSSKIMKSSPTNIETSNDEIPLHEEEVFHEKEVGVPSSNTQSISNNMIPIVDEASTSHNVFNKHLEDAYFDASTSFHDPSNVHAFNQPYPHEKKGTEDQPLHKIIDDYSWYTSVFFLHSKDEASEVIISFIKKTQVNLQLKVQLVRTDNDTEFNNKTLTKLFDEVGITQWFSAAITPQQNGVVERRNRTLIEAARTMLTFANLPSFLWAEAIATAFSQVDEASKKDLEDLFQDFYDEYFDPSKIMKFSTMNVETPIIEEVFHESIPINLVPNGDEASTSHNVFNERLEDAYFDATLRDAHWVSAIQEELDQFARLKVWRLVPRPKDKYVIKTKWIFKNKKDESSFIRNKARLVAIGYSQQESIDYDETFAPVA